MSQRNGHRLVILRAAFGVACLSLPMATTSISVPPVIARSLAHRTYLRQACATVTPYRCLLWQCISLGNDDVYDGSVEQQHSTRQTASAEEREALRWKGVTDCEQNDWQSLGSGLQVAYMAIGRIDRHTLTVCAHRPDESDRVAASLVLACLLACRLG